MNIQEVINVGDEHQQHWVKGWAALNTSRSAFPFHHLPNAKTSCRLIATTRENGVVAVAIVKTEFSKRQCIVHTTLGNYDTR